MFSNHKSVNLHLIHIYLRETSITIAPSGNEILSTFSIQLTIDRWKMGSAIQKLQNPIVYYYSSLKSIYRINGYLTHDNIVCVKGIYHNFNLMIYINQFIHSSIQVTPLNQIIIIYSLVASCFGMQARKMTSQKFL